VPPATINQYKKGDKVIYVIQVLSAILIGVAIGAVLEARHTLRVGGTIVAVVLALATMFTGNWIFLALGTALFLFTIVIRTRPAATGK
jgi:hypothetical protein